MLFPIHIKLARTILNITQEDLAKLSNLSIVTIKRLEAGKEPFKSNRAKVVKKVKNAFEQRGVEFLYPESSDMSGIGIRYNKVK